MPNDDRLVSEMHTREDVSSRDGDVRTRIDEATSQRTEHGQDSRVRRVPASGQLDARLGLGSWRRLREEAFFLEIVLSALSALGASDSQVRSTAARTLVLSNGIPKTPAQALRNEEKFRRELGYLPVLPRQGRLLVFLALGSVGAPPLDGGMRLKFGLGFAAGGGVAVLSPTTISLWRETTLNATGSWQWPCWNFLNVAGSNRPRERCSSKTS